MIGIYARLFFFLKIRGLFPIYREFNPKWKVLDGTMHSIQGIQRDFRRGVPGWSNLRNMEFNF